MAFEKKVPLWTAAGAEPPASLKESGFTPGYKPPADYFNWFWSSVSACLTELQSKSGSYDAVILEGGDLNNVTTPGLYTYSSANSANISNIPEASVQTTIWALPRLLNDDPTNVVQLAYTQSDGSYIRNQADGVWSAWRKLFSSADTISVANGGTGAKTPEEARANLSAMNLRPHLIEFAPSSTAGNGGYIDFHYNNSTEDYTSRIIEAASGEVQVVAKLKASSNHQDPATYLVRNQKLATAEETPTVNGQICWQCE